MSTDNAILASLARIENLLSRLLAQQVPVPFYAGPMPPLPQESVMPVSSPTLPTSQPPWPWVPGFYGGGGTADAPPNGRET